MIIILEGPDGAGKTTLAHQLLDYIDKQRLGNARFIHKGPPESDTLFAEYMLPLADYRPLHREHIICDRWHIGELVYPGMLGRESLADDKIAFWYVQLFLASRGALLVRVDANHDVLLSRLHERGAEVHDYEFRVSAQRERFATAFRSAEMVNATAVYRTDEVMRMSGVYTDPEQVITAAQRAEMAVTHLVEHPTYVGRPYANALLWGDVRAERDRRYPTAFVPQSATSGRFLFEALPESILRFGDHGVVNAAEDDRPDRLWRDMHHPGGVALGRNARDALMSFGVFGRTDDGTKTTGSAPHPQFVRRFHHKHGKAYAGIVSRGLKGEDLITWRP